MILFFQARVDAGASNNQPLGCFDLVVFHEGHQLIKGAGSGEEFCVSRLRGKEKLELVGCLLSMLILQSWGTIRVL